MGKMKERTIELADLALKLPTICAVSHRNSIKMKHITTENGETYGWINNIKDLNLKTCYVGVVADINWETEIITYYAVCIHINDGSPLIDDDIFDSVVFGMYKFKDAYKILSITTRARKCELFNSDKHTDWVRNMFKWMVDYYLELNEETIQKINESKTNEEEKTMSTTNETNKRDRIKVINQVEVSSHTVNDSLVVEEIDMLHLIDHVILNAPVTIVFWKDGTKTVVKCKEDDVYDPEKGIAMAFTKKVLGNNYNYINKFNTILRKAKTVEDDSKAKITFKNNEDVCDNCGCESCSCDETSMESNISIPTDEASNISGPTNEDIMQAIDLLLLRFVEIRQEVDDLKSKSKSKSKKKKKE